MKQVTLEEIGIVVLAFRERSSRHREFGIESLIGITLKALPGVAAEGEIAGITERDVFQEIEPVCPLTWVGEEAVIFVVANPGRRRLGSTGGERGSGPEDQQKERNEQNEAAGHGGGGAWSD